jgi:phosphomannomutase
LSSITCFKAYDLRGRIPAELNDDVAYRVARGYAQFLAIRGGAALRIVVGRDIRLSSTTLTDAVCRGLTDSGVDVFDIGVCGTEGVYFATFDGGYDGGIMITASHNPPDYNGMKFVREQSKPISGDNGLLEIRGFAERGEFPAPARGGGGGGGAPPPPPPGARPPASTPCKRMWRTSSPMWTSTSSSRSKSWSTPAMAAQV